MSLLLCLFTAYGAYCGPSALSPSGWLMLTLTGSAFKDGCRPDF